MYEPHHHICYSWIGHKDLVKLVHFQPLQREEMKAAAQAVLEGGRSLNCPFPPWLFLPPNPWDSLPPLYSLRAVSKQVPWSPLLASLTPEVFSECKEYFLWGARSNHNYCHKNNFSYGLEANTSNTSGNCMEGRKDASHSHLLVTSSSPRLLWSEWSHVYINETAKYRVSTVPYAYVG